MCVHIENTLKILLVSAGLPELKLAVNSMWHEHVVLEFHNDPYRPMAPRVCKILPFYSSPELKGKHLSIVRRQLSFS